MNRKLAAAASVALIALAACRSKTEAYDTTSATGAYATPPAVVGATTGAAGITAGATTTAKPDTAMYKDTTKKTTKAP
ncbi:MAG TPA: hypothetical protein VFT29_11900 [Gemmatimonadaceae bacterium]|nr:hypothetical protein [Gemmatimonadaceae bacterium]